MLTTSKIKILGASVLVASFLVSGSVFAANIPSNAKTRLQDAKLKACQARENVIKNRSNSLGKLTDGMVNHFDQIVIRVEKYYTEKVVPSGKTVSNYDALLADIQTKKSAVSTALQKAKDDFKSFSCTEDDPKGVLTQFREDMQSVKQALKDYRTSIKNLIVAVHSVVGDENKDQQNENQQDTNSQQSNEQKNNQ